MTINFYFFLFFFFFLFLLRSSLSCQPKNMEKPVFALQCTAAVKINKQQKISCRWAFRFTTAHCALYRNGLFSFQFLLKFYEFHWIHWIIVVKWYWEKIAFFKFLNRIMKSLTAVVLIGIYALAGSYLLSIEIQIVQCKIVIIANQCFLFKSVAMKGKNDKLHCKV